jgi:predicted nucleic acid-binding protein
MKTVYFDTNVYTHIYTRDGVTEADVLRLKELIKADKIRILSSIEVAEETMSAIFAAPKEAIGRLKLIHKLAKRKKMVKHHTQFIQAVYAYAEGGKVHSPFTSPPLLMRKFLIAPDLDVVREIATENKEQIQKHHDDIADIYKTKVEPLAQTIRQQRQEPTFEDYWNDMAIPYIEELARLAGVLEQCQARGLDGLLAIRCLRIHTLGQVSLNYANTYTGRTPKHSDSRDMHHVLVSSAAEAFITDDGPLRRVMSRMQVEGYEVLSFREMMERIH